MGRDSSQPDTQLSSAQLCALSSRHVASLSVDPGFAHVGAPCSFLDKKLLFRLLSSPFPFPFRASLLLSEKVSQDPPFLFPFQSTFKSSLSLFTPSIESERKWSSSTVGDLPLLGLLVRLSQKGLQRSLSLSLSLSLSQYHLISTKLCFGSHTRYLLSLSLSNLLSTSKIKSNQRLSVSPLQIPLSLHCPVSILGEKLICELEFWAKKREKFCSMGTISHSSLSYQHEEASAGDEALTQEGLLFSDSLKDLKNLRTQLYSAADYFELFYKNNSRKPAMINGLKDYTVEALVSTVDHLGFVSYKVNNLLIEKVDEVSEAEFRVSTVEQRVRTCQEIIDQEGMSQQSLVIKAPKFHKHYTLPGEDLLDSGLQPIKTHQKRNERPSQFNMTAISPPMRKPPPLRKMHSQSSNSNNSPRSRSPSRSPQTPNSPLKEKRSLSPLPTSRLLSRAASLATRSNSRNSSPSRHSMESERPTNLNFERNYQKETEKKSKGLLKSLLTRRRSKKADESLYSYLDEY
ncbi:hypothetical protein LUZ60_009985 [Juncus effusus]|nr:hypothetical protein LUZ60_009985 [Juncus effusus]